MKDLLRSSVIFLCLLSISENLSAQKPPIKLGDISMEEITMKNYDNDTSADAVVLCDFGISKIEYDNTNSDFQITTDRICRIKIFNDNAFKWASESVHLFNDMNTKEVIYGIKGFTYNLENGKIEKDKLDKSSIFEEKTSDEWTEHKFTLPNVKAGSVIEYTYIVKSNSMALLDAWEFQKSIPVAWSEYYIEIPEYFHYLQISTGFEPLAINETSSLTKSITWLEKSREFGSRNNIQTSYSSNKVDYTANRYHWAVKDAPALKDESYVGNLNDYTTKIEFQLANYQYPGGQFHEILGTWDQVNDQFLNHIEDFKNNISKRNFYKDDLDKILGGSATDEEKVTGIYYFVADRIQWNEKNGFIPEQNIRKTYDDRTGNAADINALLISMLKAADIDAEPVILSTRSHGQVHPIYPILGKYNYLIASVYLDGKILLLDATDKNLPPGTLPVRCLNKRGRVLSMNHSDWISLDPETGANTISICTFNIEDNKLCGEIQSRKSGYAAYLANKKYTVDGEDKYIEALKDIYKNWDIDAYTIENDDITANGFKENFTVKVSESLTAGGAHLYLEPILIDKWDENPLKNENRKLPVDFQYPIQKRYIFNLTIPEGYVVEELPQSVQFSLPDKSANFTYMIKSANNTLQLTNLFEINRNFYTQEEYKNLREFWAMVVAKCNEQIVLKKAT